jgi:hypothetical protein
MDSLTKPEAILWARKDIWTVDETAFLLSGISPKQLTQLSHDYDLQHFPSEEAWHAAGVMLRSANDNAVSIKTVLQMSQPVAQTPAGWVRHAETSGLDVPPVLRAAIEGNGHSGVSEKTIPTQPVPAAINLVGVTKAEILCVEWPMPASAPPLKNVLCDIPKWVDAACTKVGRPGKGAGGSHLWNPAMLACCLATKTPQKQWGVGKGVLTRFLRTNFAEYLEQWETATSDL